MSWRTSVLLADLTTADLLATVQPSLPERMVDCFERLLDDPLAE